ncbi:pPIWI-associating nuclease domain-containing protein [Vibrio mediterranei]
MKLRKLKEHSFIRAFTVHLETEFEKRLFESALRNYCSMGNPIRFNNFAFAMRELLKHVLARKAPEEKVKQCVWFKPDVNNNGYPTRRQQLKYCMQAGLQDNLLSDDIKDDINELINQYNEHISELNGYTHISDNTYGEDPRESYKKLKSVVSTFNEAMEIIEQGKSEVLEYIPERLGDFVEQEITSEIPEALDELSSHTFVEEVQLDGFEIDSIDHEFVYITGSSTAYVTLNYGSNSDRKRGDGHSMNEDFPVSFKCKAKVNNPKRAFVIRDSISVSNASWFGEA